jgi:hypothetical protein
LSLAQLAPLSIPIALFCRRNELRRHVFESTLYGAYKVRALPGSAYFKQTSLTTYNRTDQELAINIKKATNSEEISPKRKHVRACIVYTWDHRSASAFWSGIKVYVLRWIQHCNI